MLDVILISAFLVSVVTFFWSKWYILNKISKLDKTNDKN